MWAAVLVLGWSNDDITVRTVPGPGLATTLLPIRRYVPGQQRRGAASAAPPPRTSPHPQQLPRQSDTEAVAGRAAATTAGWAAAAARAERGHGAARRVQARYRRNGHVSVLSDKC